MKEEAEKLAGSIRVVDREVDLDVDWFWDIAEP
jgi:hypothetical protein